MPINKIKYANKLVKSKEDFIYLIDDLKLNNEDFTVLYSSAKTVIINGRLKYSYYPNAIKKTKGLYFIKKLATYIQKNNIRYSFNLKINYNKLNSFLGKNYIYKKELYEVDLKAAYWHFAKKNGFINDELFKEGLRVDKKIRLMSLGGLAKNTNVFNYKEGELKSTEKINSHETEGIFFKVAYDTDLIMRKLLNILDKKDFCFYWVDAIFFRGRDNLEKIKAILENEDLPFKVVEIKKMQRKETKIIVEDFNYKVRNFEFKKQNNISLNN